MDAGDGWVPKGDRYGVCSIANGVDVRYEAVGCPSGPASAGAAKRLSVLWVKAPGGGGGALLKSWVTRLFSFGADKKIDRDFFFF